MDKPIKYIFAANPVSTQAMAAMSAKFGALAGAAAAVPFMFTTTTLFTGHGLTFVYDGVTTWESTLQAWPRVVAECAACALHGAFIGALYGYFTGRMTAGVARGLYTPLTERNRDDCLSTFRRLYLLVMPLALVVHFMGLPLMSNLFQGQPQVTLDDPDADQPTNELWYTFPGYSRDDMFEYLLLSVILALIAGLWISGRIARWYWDNTANRKIDGAESDATLALRAQTGRLLSEDNFTNVLIPVVVFSIIVAWFMGRRLTGWYKVYAARAGSAPEMPVADEARADDPVAC
jgi:hypothetical protein